MSFDGKVLCVMGGVGVRSLVLCVAGGIALLSIGAVRLGLCFPFVVDDGVEG